MLCNKANKNNIRQEYNGTVDVVLCEFLNGRDGMLKTEKEKKIEYDGVRTGNETIFYI